MESEPRKACALNNSIIPCSSRSRRSITGPAFAAAEGCAVAIHHFREFLGKGRALVWDERSEQWRSIWPSDVCPGMVVMLPRSAGGYSVQLGWTGQVNDKLDTAVTDAWLTGSSTGLADENAVQPPSNLRGSLSFLYRLAKELKARREVVRGKPETFNRPDYNFRLVENQGAEPHGAETVQISVRQRGAPLDLIVSEAMILANSTWGGWLAELGVPGIYRSQASLAPGIKVRMGTKALPHAGIGVKSYAWSTSPLRRYTDLVNQWQIIACVRHGKTAALAAPFKPKDAELFSIISAFDAAYTAYNGYQGGMERFWTLRYLQQNAIT